MLRGVLTAGGMSKFSKQGVLLFVLLSYAANSFAAVPDAAQVLANIANIVPEFIRLVTAFAYITGICFILRGIYQLKQYGELRTMMSSQTSLVGPLVYLLIGSAMIYLIGLYDATYQTFFTGQSPLGYPITGYGAKVDSMIKSVIIIMKLIGVIAFIRGWIILTKLGGGHGSAQPGTAAKGVTHVIGGLFAYNIPLVFELLKETIGWT